MVQRNTISGYSTSNPEDEHEQDPRDDSEDVYLDSFRIRHNVSDKESRTHPDRAGKYTKKFR